MKRIADIFAVSIIAIVSVNPAHAEIVSTELLNTRLATTGNLHKVAASGSYADLANKPTIPAAQVQADWNATEGVAAIKNKPTIPAAQVQSDWDATTGMGAIKNKPTLGALAAKSAVASADITDGTITNADISDTAGITKGKLDSAVQTSLGKADSALQKHQDISGKEDISNKVSSTTGITSAATDTQYPSAKAVYTELGKKQNTLTSAQLSAVSSGITSDKVATYDGYANQIAGKQASLGYTAENSANKTTTIAAAASASDDKYPSEKAVASALAGKQAAGDYATKSENTATLNSAKSYADGLASNYATAAQGVLAASAVQPSAISDMQVKANKTTTIAAAASASDDKYPSEKAVASALAGKMNNVTLATVATSGSYNDLTNKPNIPTGSLAAKSTIKNEDVAADAAIAPTKIAIETVATYDKVSGDGEKDKRIPSLAVVQAVAGTVADAAVISAKQELANTYQEKSTAVTHTANMAAGDSTHPVYIASTGAATKIDKVAAASMADEATGAKKICSGSTCGSYIDVWVE